MKVGQWLYPSVHVDPSYATNKSVVWSSNKTSVASVNATKGYIHANSVGNAIITATALDGSGVKGSISVTVKAASNSSSGTTDTYCNNSTQKDNCSSCETDTETVLVSSIKLSPKNLAIEENGWYYTPSVTITPEDATNKSIAWSSDDTSVASINPSSGYIYGISQGTATITAMAIDGSGITGTCTVTVIPASTESEACSGDSCSDSSSTCGSSTSGSCNGSSSTCGSSTEGSCNGSSSSDGSCSGSSSTDGSCTGSSSTSGSCSDIYYDQAQDSRIKVRISKDTASNINFPSESDAYFSAHFFDNHNYWKSIQCNLTDSDVNGETRIGKRYLTNKEQNFSVEQLAFLYRFDPLGVEQYVKFNAPNLDDNNLLLFKDKVYYSIFNQKPRLFRILPDKSIRYFKYPNEISAETRYHYYSDAEILFGDHMISDNLAIAGFITNFLKDLFKMTFEDTIYSLELCQALFFSGSITEIFTTAASDFLNRYISTFSVSDLSDAFSWITNLFTLALENAIDSFRLPNPNDITIYHKIQENNNYKAYFLIDGYEYSMEEIISHCENNC